MEFTDSGWVGQEPQGGEIGARQPQSIAGSYDFDLYGGDMILLNSAWVPPGLQTLQMENDSRPDALREVDFGHGMGLNNRASTYQGQGLLEMNNASMPPPTSEVSFDDGSGLDEDDETATYCG